MPFITFIYKVGKNHKTYYGKYCFDYISDDHEGLDNEVKYILKQISKDELAKIIYRNDAQRKKLTELLHIYELLSVVGT